MGIKRLLINSYKGFIKSPRLHKFFYVLAIIVIIHLFTKMKLQGKEGFDNIGEENEYKIELKEKYELKESPALYDDFYAEVYDELLFSKLKDDFEVGEIINSTKPNKSSIILDVGSGTGHHVSNFVANGFKAQGVDISPAMVKKAQENYPELQFKQGDIMDTMLFPGNSFTHITCLYFTIYYIKDKRRFFSNVMHWLQPGGYLALHLVDRDNFDPIVPAGDPFSIVSPQKFAKERITSTVVKFNNLDYKSNFELLKDKETNNDGIINAIMHETFKDTKTGALRKNEHKLYMPTQKTILSMAKDAGFILTAKIDMVKCQYANQFIYILQKPT